MGCTHANERTVVPPHQSRLTDEQIEELLNTRFNQSEILDWYQVFSAKCGAKRHLSSNASTACINKSLFIDYFNRLHPNGDVTPLTEAFFRTYDLNNDGTIDFMGFMHAVSIIRRGDLKEKLAFLFSLLDADQKGYIDRLKLVQMMEALYQIQGINYRDSYNILLEKVDHIIHKLDKERVDGRISKQQFIENCLNDLALKDSLYIHR